MRFRPPESTDSSEFRVLDADEESDYIHRVNLRVQRELWDETGDPAIALEVLVYCMDARIYPPSWVMEWIGSAAISFFEANGDADLHQLLGLRNGPGRAAPLTRRSKELVMDNLAYVVWVLNRILGEPIGEAAYKAVRRAEWQGDEGHIPSPEWLEQRCRRGLLTKWDLEMESLRGLYDQNGALDKFIQTFPPDARPMC